MKRIVYIACITIVILSGCKKEKDIDQLPFEMKKMATLLGKSSDYIKDASPGTIDEDNDDYLYFLLENEMEGIDRSYVFYNLTNDKCDYIVIFSNYLDVLEHARTLMNLVEDEFGKGLLYYLAYTDSMLLEKDFNSFDSLWQYIGDNAIVVDSVDEVTSLHHYDDYYYFSGGMYFAVEDYFMSLIEIGLWEELNLKSAPAKGPHKERFRFHFREALPFRDN